MKYILLVLFSLGFVVGCNKDDDKNNDPVADIREAAEDPNLQGETFVGPCQARPVEAIVTGLFTGGDAAAKSLRVQYEFSGNDLIRRTHVFTQAECQGDVAVSFLEKGNIDVLAEDRVTTDNGRHIDFKFETLVLKVENAAGVEIANSVDLCGESNWTAGAERDITTKAKDVNCYGVEVPRAVANIYRLDNNSVLYLGKSDRTGNASERPTALDLETKFTKKD